MIAAVLLLISIPTAIQVDKACLEDPRDGKLLSELFQLTEGLLPMVVMSPEKINTSFLLFTRASGEKYQTIVAANVSAVEDSNFDPNKNSVFIIHGYASNPTAWATTHCQRILSVDDVNCICVDWKNGAKDVYPQAIYNAPVVAAALACFTSTLRETYGNYNGSRMLFSGHSLGAHVAGMAARMYAEIARDIINKILGLDPAGPLIDAKTRLKPTDAVCVEAIYTDTGSFIQNLFTSGYGTPHVCGNRNFYPNGGKKQPGCENSVVNFAKDPQNHASCNHAFAHQLYLASIVIPFLAIAAPNYAEFENGTGFPCSNESCTLMGYNADSCSSSNETSFFYFNTGAQPPYILYRVSAAVEIIAPPSMNCELRITLHYSTAENDTYSIYSGDLHNGTHTSFLDVQKETPPENVTVTCSTSDPCKIKIRSATLQDRHNKTSVYCPRDAEATCASSVLVRCG